MNSGDKTCPKCAETIKAEAKLCRYCGHSFETAAVPLATERKKKRSKARGCVASLAVGLLAIIVLGQLVKPGSKLASSPIGVDTQVQNIKNKVADDAMNQYGIAVQNGTPIDRCVQAGLVSAAFLQAQNSEAYGRWKEVEKADCAKAGVLR